MNTTRVTQLKENKMALNKIRLSAFLAVCCVASLSVPDKSQPLRSFLRW
jgi:hypothetical protein